MQNRLKDLQGKKEHGLLAAILVMAFMRTD